VQARSVLKSGEKIVVYKNERREREPLGQSLPIRSQDS